MGSVGALLAGLMFAATAKAAAAPVNAIAPAVANAFLRSMIRLSFRALGGV
jgi:hypothetical protein